MKYALTIFLLFVVFTTNAQKSFKTAISYNDYIVEQQTAIGLKILDFNKVVNVTVNYDTLMMALKEIDKTIDKSLKNLKNTIAFEKETELKTSALNLFQFYKRIMNNEYKEMIKILSKGEYSEEDSAKMSEILDKVVKDENAFDATFLDAQKKFAEKYGFTLQESELQEKIDESTDK